MRKELTNAEIKQELTRMLKQVDAFLAEHHIRYGICYGTLLGAVRHKGFIPWDDDIDLMMVRPEYEKFLNLIRSGVELPGGLTVEGFELNNSDTPFLKVVDRSIACQEDVYNNGKNIDDSYLWVDIFPWDGLPDRGRKLYTLLRQITLRICWEKKVIKNNWEYHRGIVAKCINLIARPFPFSTLLKVHIALSKMFDIRKADEVNCNVWGSNDIRAIPVDVIKSYSRYHFEDIIVKGPKNYDGLLSRIYGDYMELPPEDKRISHGLRAWRDYEE